MRRCSFVGSDPAGVRESSDFGFAVRRLSRSAAEPKSRSALREISLVISFNGASSSSAAVAALSSCLGFGAVGGDGS